MRTGTAKSVMASSLGLVLLSIVLSGCGAHKSNLASTALPETPMDQPTLIERPEKFESTHAAPSPEPRIPANLPEPAVITPDPLSEQVPPHEGGISVSILSPEIQPAIPKTLPEKPITSSPGINLNTASLRWQASTNTAQVGDQITLTIAAEQVSDLYSAPFYVRYDPGLLEFIGLTEGKFLKQDGNSTVFIYTVEPETGRVIVGLSRLGQVPGISGSGTLALATFRAKSPGSASVEFQNIDFRDIALEPIEVTPESGEIEVR